MIFQKKLDRAMNWNKSKNNSEIEELDPETSWDGENEEIYLEKKDRLALFLSALLVFSPIFLILIAVLIWSLKI